jgi:hypothetical protein
MNNLLTNTKEKAAHNGIEPTVNRKELIQQWQYPGPVCSELLEDRIFEAAKQTGLTSVQSYVCWAEIEKQPGRFDFSSYDPLVQKLTEHKLKWVPFLILGPCYATPKWFRQSEKSIYAKCLEHNKESKIQSIWNPYLPEYVEHFLRIFSTHYHDKDTFESIMLGISGNWGESLFPATGGFTGNFHTHPGWWCGDKYALRNFQEDMIRKYGSVDLLNAAWDTCLSDATEISFPRTNQSWWQCYRHKIPSRVKQLLRKLYRSAKRLQKTGELIFKSINRISRSEIDTAIIPPIRWFDFVQWYQQSMTNWAEFWIRTARQYFKETKIYLVAGGHGESYTGTDFSEQTKMASKYNAGIRITNQSDNYNSTFARSRLISTASRFYGSYFTTEEAGINSAAGVTARLYDAATSGADGVYFKNIIGMGKDKCTGRTFALGQLTEGAANLEANLRHFKSSLPVINIAALFPAASAVIEPAVLDLFYRQVADLREEIDFDIVDENMIADGVLDNYRFLVHLQGDYWGNSTLDNIVKWTANGGVFITADHLNLYGLPHGGRAQNYSSDLQTGLNTVNKGHFLKFDADEHGYLEYIASAVYNNESNYGWVGEPNINIDVEGVYSTRFEESVLFYNSKSNQIIKSIRINQSNSNVDEIYIEPHSITSVLLSGMQD